MSNHARKQPSANSECKIEGVYSRQWRAYGVDDKAKITTTTTTTKKRESLLVAAANSTALSKGGGLLRSRDLGPTGAGSSYERGCWFDVINLISVRRVCCCTLVVPQPRAGDSNLAC